MCKDGRRYVRSTGNYSKNQMKIDANAERGDKSAKLVVKVDLEGSWPAFGKDLGGSGPPSWSQVEPSWL